MQRRKCVGSSEGQRKWKRLCCFCFWTQNVWYASWQIQEMSGQHKVSHLVTDADGAGRQKRCSSNPTPCVSHHLFWLLFRFCLSCLHRSASPCYTGPSHTFFLLTFGHIPTVYRLPEIQFVPQKCPVQFWTWSVGEMGLKKAAARITLVHLNCYMREEVWKEADNTTSEWIFVPQTENLPSEVITSNPILQI